MNFENGLPSDKQELLLKAALLNKELAAKEFDKWFESVDFNNLDHISMRILPLLYRNLSEYLKGFEIYPKLRGIYLKNLYKNKILLDELKKMTKCFRKNNLDYIALKGNALMLSYYENIGDRPTGDIDIIVRKENIDEVISKLKELNYNPRLFWDERIITFKREWAFIKNRHLKVDLQWNILERYEYKDYDELWNNTQILNYEENEIVVLNPTYQLMHIIIHGFTPHGTYYPTYWVADAVRIIKKSMNEINWQSLLSESLKLGYGDILKGALKYIENNFGVSVPNLNVSQNYDEISSKKDSNLQLRTNSLSMFFWKIKRYFDIKGMHKTESKVNLISYSMLLLKIKRYVLLAKFNRRKF